MTLLSDPPVPGDVEPSVTPPDAEQVVASRRALAQPGKRRVVPLVLVVVLATLACLVLVIYALEPMFERRAQRHLLEDYREHVDRTANQAQGFAGVEVPTEAPALGSPVAILETNALQWQQVIVEGVSSSQLQRGPGHVPGTSTPGQPGNTVIVGRRATYGGPFERLGALGEGDEIVFTTTQGQSVYTVESVEQQTLSSSGSTGDGVTAIDDLYGSSDDDRLTLVTSASDAPWNDSEAIVVVASLQGAPFAPTPQNERDGAQSGLTGGSFELWSGLLILGGLVATVIASIWCYRRYSTWVAYLLTIGPLLVLTILAAETISRLLPAWT